MLSFAVGLGTGLALAWVLMRRRESSPAPTLTTIATPWAHVRAALGSKVSRADN